MEAGLFIGMFVLIVVGIIEFGYAFMALNNTHRFVLPVIGNCNCSGSTQPVVGFVAIQIDDPSQVITQGGSKRITGAKQVCNSQLSAGSIGVAAGDFGAQEVRLAQ